MKEPYYETFITEHLIAVCLFATLCLFTALTYWGCR